MTIIAVIELKAFYLLSPSEHPARVLGWQSLILL